MTCGSDAVCGYRGTQRHCLHSRASAQSFMVRNLLCGRPLACKEEPHALSGAPDTMVPPFLWLQRCTLWAAPLLELSQHAAR